MSVEEQIKSKLSAAFSPIELTLINESHKHKGHPGHNGSGESHFRLRIVSDAFTGQNRISRQRAIYEALSAEFKAGLHALSIQAHAPGEKTKQNTS